MAATSTLYPTTVATTTGTTWTTTTNATGSGTGTTSAAWAVFTNATNGGSGGTGTINLSGYAAQAAGPASGDTIDSVVLSLRGNVSATARWTAASCTAQLFDGTTAIGSPVAIGTLSTSTSNVWTITFTGANAPSYAQLSDLRVRVTAVHTSTTSSTFNVDTAGLVVNYTAPTVPTITDSVSAIPNLSARYRADQITGVTDGVGVASWPDASGNGYTATQATSGSRPTYQGSVVNGQPVVRWPAASRFLASAAPAGSANQTLIAVIKPADTSAVRTIRGASGSGGVQFRTEFPNGAPAILRENQAAIATATTGTDTVSFHSVIATLTSATGAWSFYVDGVAAGSGTAAAQSLTATTTILGDKETGTTENFWGDIAEIVVFDRVLTGPEIATVNSYIATQYGIGSATTVTGSGALTASPPTLAGSGTLTVTGAGTGTGTPATLSGAGTARLTGAGALTATTATLSGAGTLAVAGAGSLTAPPAALAGTGTLSVTGTGTPAATPATLAGTGAERLTGTGALSPSPATLSGSGTVASPGVVGGTGALAAPPAGMSGAGTLKVVGAGQLTAQAATAAAFALLSLAGAGTLSAAPASLTGTGTVVDPTAPIVHAGPFETLVVGADHRILAVTGEQRTLEVSGESRRLQPVADQRTDTVPAVLRNLATVGS